MNCRRCVHAFLTNLKTAQELRRQGYRQGVGDFRHDEGCVCTRHQVVASVATPKCGFRDVEAEALVLRTTANRAGPKE